MYRKETSEQRLGRIRAIWPEAKHEDIIWIEPIGSRQDALIYWRKGKRLTTGDKYAPAGEPKPACFEGSAADFRCNLRSPTYTGNDRVKREYLAALAFLESLECLS